MTEGVGGGNCKTYGVSVQVRYTWRFRWDRNPNFSSAYNENFRYLFYMIAILKI